MCNTRQWRWLPKSVPTECVMCTTAGVKGGWGASQRWSWLPESVPTECVQLQVRRADGRKVQHDSGGGSLKACLLNGECVQLQVQRVVGVHHNGGVGSLKACLLNVYS